MVLPWANQPFTHAENGTIPEYSEAAASEMVQAREKANSRGILATPLAEESLEPGTSLTFSWRIATPQAGFVQLQQLG